MYAEITSPQNPHVRNALRLRTRRGRRQQGRIIIDGIRELHSAVKCHVEIERIFVSDQYLSKPAVQAILADIDDPRAAVLTVSQRVFEKLAFGGRAEGVVAVALPPRRALADVQLSGDVLVGVLEGLEKPGNVGAVLRSADGAGVNAVVAANGGTDIYNPNAIRASLGTVFSLQVCAAGTGEVVSWLGDHHLRVLLARVDGPIDYTRADYTGAVAIVLGGESRGLSPQWNRLEHQAIRLPMCGKGDSLNVSAAAAVLFYEARRQRRLAAP